MSPNDSLLADPFRVLAHPNESLKHWRVIKPLLSQAPANSPKPSLESFTMIYRFVVPGRVFSGLSAARRAIGRRVWCWRPYSRKSVCASSRKTAWAPFLALSCARWASNHTNQYVTCQCQVSTRQSSGSSHSKYLLSSSRRCLLGCSVPGRNTLCRPWDPLTDKKSGSQHHLWPHEK